MRRSPSRAFEPFVLALALAGVYAVVEPAPAQALNENCNHKFFAMITLPPNTVIDSVTSILAAPPLPAYCNVKGHYADSITVGGVMSTNRINFGVALPDSASWNSRFLFMGNGGFAGTIPDVTGIAPASFASPLAQGYTTAGTDTGHSSALPTALVELDGSWALDDLIAQEDFGTRAVHFTALAAQDLTHLYYGATVSHKYFDGCSTDGRQAMVEAQQFPTDFDGIIAGDPAIGLAIAGFNWNYQALFKTVNSWLPPTKLALLDSAVRDACDGLDGVEDGLIQDPRICPFDPGVLKCAASDPAPDLDPLCLSGAQVKAVRAIYQGAITSKGVQLYPGYTKSDPGGDFDDPTGADGGGLWITGFNTPTIPPPANGEPWGSGFVRGSAACSGPSRISS